METVVITYVISAIACLCVIYNYRSILKLKQSISDMLVESIKILEPGNRYIITLPASMTDDEFNDAFEVINSHLNLENSDTYVVIMHGDIRIVEFS